MEHERKGDHGRRGQSHEEFWYTKLRNFLNRVFFFNYYYSYNFRLCKTVVLKNMVCQAAESASPGNLLDKLPVSTPHLLDTDSEILEVGLCNLGFNKPSGEFCSMCKLEKHRSIYSSQTLLNIRITWGAFKTPNGQATLQRN